MRMYSDDEIYMLSNGQMNGRHKEIFSLNLFTQNLRQKEVQPFSKKQ